MPATEFGPAAYHRCCSGLRGGGQLADRRRRPFQNQLQEGAAERVEHGLRGWIERDLAPVRELRTIRDIEYVDLATGHWPQFTRPEQLATVILASIDRG